MAKQGIGVVTDESFDRLEAISGSDWIPVREYLPPMFKNVLVCGTTIGGECGVIQARRWTGWSSGWPGIEDGIEPPWEWLTKSDRRVYEVDRWKPVGYVRLSPFKIDNKYRQEIKVTLTGIAEERK